MDRTGGLGRGMARNAPREAELLEQSLHAPRVLRDMRIDLAVGTFEPGIGNDAGTPMARPSDVHHVKITGPYDPVQVHIDEVQPRRGSPMSEQTRLDVLKPQRLPQQRVVVQVDLADRQVVCSAPPGIDQTAL